ncbi:glycoside hydrolase family 2 protein [Ktedonobacter sp. SOSP1-52]|uniref:beta-mannosidase n=1 Tax=Ktedonobacter sp. SOSP1-52 TaxID=2778366 RepID=UPI001F1D7E3B|nr:glycoside hydrolase family 2 protein [Ktedonobacter sp. SOSP1-52]
MKKLSLPLATNWLVKERNMSLSVEKDGKSEEGWIPASVPGTVHQALLDAKRIPDPFQGTNENDIQWIGERDWLYRCSFTLIDDVQAAEHVVLHFEGLDTYATVWLNGVEIARSTNMFVPLHVEVTNLLRPGQNELLINFESALRLGQTLEAQHGKHTSWNGDSSRLYVRKAQYHYGWDWGPILLTAGPWRAISLLAYKSRIVDVLSQTEVSPDLESALLSVTTDIELGGTDPANVSCSVSIYDSQNTLVGEQELPGTTLELLPDHGQYRLQARLQIVQPQLWWPRGYGAQPLYRLVVTLHDEQGSTLDQREIRTGLRRLELSQHAFSDQPGSSFYFTINNTPIFCGGANWIPADSLTPRISPERYRAWVQLAADANMAMLRVWGGGIYEEDVFYDACDELGILVWQDFMFACGMYPALDWFQASVRAEAEAAVRRLHHHPSIALWCGNNEDYLIASSQGHYDATFEGDFTAIQFSARELYERVLPEVCARLDPSRPYWRGSPYGGTNGNNPEVGDQHVWDVWHGFMRKYQDYSSLGGRFISEFGMQATPVRATIEAFTSAEERYPLSRTLEHHNKASDGSRRLAVYLSDTVRNPADLDSYIYATQLVQSEALCSGIQGWRRQWQGPGKEYIGGALVWQINDCWPVTSWAMVDYYLRPKPAYYSVRRELAPIVVGLATQDKQQAAVWAVNATQQPLDVHLALQWWTLEGELVDEQDHAYTLAPNQATELQTAPFATTTGHILGARLLQGDQVLAQATLWPEPFKYLTLPEPGIHVERLGPDTLSLQTQRPAKGVWLTAEDGVKWSDNMLDLLPGESYILKVEGLKHDSVIHIDWLRS